MISGEIGVNQFAQIRLILEVIFGDDPLGKVPVNMEYCNSLEVLYEI